MTYELSAICYSGRSYKVTDLFCDYFLYNFIPLVNAIIVKPNALLLRLCSTLRVLVRR